MFDFGKTIRFSFTPITKQYIIIQTCKKINKIFT